MNSIFSVFNQRENEAAVQTKILDEKRQELKMAKANNHINKNLKERVVNQLYVREADHKKDAIEKLPEKGILGNLFNVGVLNDER